MSVDVFKELERSKLHFAAQKGDMNKAKELLKEGHPVNAFDDLGKTPLHYAAQSGHLEMMKLLIDSGADVNARDSSQNGHTALGDIAGDCSFEVAKLLVEAGADPTIPGWMQLTALSIASQRKRPEGLKVYKLLQEAATTPESRSGKKGE